VLAAQGPGADELELKADFALGVVSQLGWVAFEEFAFMLADIDQADRDTLRQRIREKLQHIVGTLMEPGRSETDGSGTRR